MTHYELVLERLKEEPRKWLITGVAGFIGSNLLETLLKLGQKVVGLDNFSTGYTKNLDEVKASVKAELWSNFNFVEGDIRNLSDCRKVCEGVDYVLHQAALGSVPWSIDDPISTNATNIDGFLNMLVAARDCGTKRFVYAASSATYGDDPTLPKVEDVIGQPLSPYAVTKYVNELYAEVFSRAYGFQSIGLRYFNVFGKRQDPNGAYAAVIPKWISAMLNDEQVFINGDGEIFRDFCFVDNVIQSNLLAATVADDVAVDQIYNVALGARTSLKELFELLRCGLLDNKIEYSKEVQYRDFRGGDIIESQASIEKIKRFMKYEPEFDVKEGVSMIMPWYISFIKKSL